MLNMLTNVALDFHLSLKAEHLFSVGSFSVTNSMVYGLITSAILLWFMLRAGRKISIKPSRGINAIIEIVTEFIVSTIESPLGSREAALKYTPYFGVYFFLVIFTNLMGLLPFVGSSLYAVVAGEHVPLLRPFTADLNATIAMSIFAVGLVQYLSIKQQGLKNHLRHYFPGKFYNPMDLFMSFIEVITEFTKVVSLSLRLFLNTAVGEILIAVFSNFIISHGRTPLLALPMVVFEVMIAAIQAYVYIILCASYLGLTLEGHNDIKQSKQLANVSGA
jgi:F-type H+-transporting ATPase subunit a